MPRFKPVIREQKGQMNSNGTYNIKIRVTHKGKTRYKGTEYHVKPNQIDSSGTVVNHDNASQYNIQLRNVLNLFDKTVVELGVRVKTMEMKTLLAQLKEADPLERDSDFVYYAEKHIMRLISEGREPHAKTIGHTVNKVKEYSSAEVVLFSEITTSFLEDFRTFLKYKGNSTNTINLHFRNIKLVFNRAIDAEKVSADLFPFRRFKFKQERTRKRNLELEELQKLILANPTSKSQQRAKDLFMLSFYLIGINFKDLLYAKKENVYKGRLEYKREKTKRPYSIKIIPEAQEIIDRYSGEKFLISIMEYKHEKAKLNRSTFLHKDIISQTNKQLKRIAIDIGINESISTYWGRHSWATIANNIGVPKDDIAAALGHGEETVTDVYIDPDLERIDRANFSVIKHLRSFKSIEVA